MLVSDLERQRHLFVDILGLSVLAEYPGYLRIGGREGFHVGMEQGNPGPPNAMEITIQVDDVDQMYERLVEAGVEVEGPPRIRTGALGTPGSGTATVGGCRSTLDGALNTGSQSPASW